MPRGDHVDWKRLLVYISGTVDQELLLCNECLVTKNRVLRNQLKGASGSLTGNERQDLSGHRKALIHLIPLMLNNADRW